MLPAIPNMFCPPSVFWMKRELNLTIFLIALKSATPTSRGSLTTKKVTPSAQGGVVSEPEYCRMSEVWILDSTLLKSRPSSMVVLVPGLAIASRLEERPAMMGSLSEAET